MQDLTQLGGGVVTCSRGACGFLQGFVPFSPPQHTLPLGSLHAWTLHLIVGCIVSNNVDVVITTLLHYPHLMFLDIG